MASILWDDGGTIGVGAVTFGNGTSGISGVVSVSNSLIGSQSNDAVGVSGVTALTNGNYVVATQLWDDGGTANVGAVTFGSGTTGISGVVSTSNSLYGSSISDQVGVTSVTALTNGNYVVVSKFWDDGATVELFYQKRVPEVQIQNENLSEEFYRILEEENLDETQQAKLEKDFATEMEVIKRDDRLDKTRRGSRVCGS